MKSVAEALYLNQDNTVFRVAQNYTVLGSPYNLFTISGGAVWIKLLAARITANAAGGTTFDVTVNGVAVDSGPVVVGGAVGSIIIIPLDSTATATIVNADATSQIVWATSDNTMIAGTSGGAVIQLAVAVATITVEWTCIYRRLSPSALIK